MTAPTDDEVTAMIAENLNRDEDARRILRGDFLPTLHKRNADMLSAQQAEIARLTGDRDALKAAKWDVQHTDTMNDFILLGLDRDEWKARAERAEATGREVTTKNED